MSDMWMPSLHLKMTRQEFDRLPRHPSYQYDYRDEHAHLSPWPRYYHAQLDLHRVPAETQARDSIHLGPVTQEQHEDLLAVFASGFAHLQPFGSLDETQRCLAVEQSFQQTLGGGDGPWVEAASLIAKEEERLVGAILITLLPGGNPQNAASFHWQERPATDLWERGEGQPHLTWIFVARPVQGHGVGTCLLQESVRVLKRQGYRSLWTTFMLGNDSSLLWHWRNGFELLPHARSKR